MYTGWERSPDGPQDDQDAVGEAITAAALLAIVLVVWLLMELLK